MSDPVKMKYLRFFFRKFPRAIKAVAQVAETGDAKHNGTARSFLGIENGHQEYSEAMVRHIFDEIVEGPVDQEDGKHLHAARIAWNALSRLELQLEARLGEVVDYQYEGGPLGEAKQSIYDKDSPPPVDPANIKVTIYPEDFWEKTKEAEEKVDE